MTETSAPDSAAPDSSAPDFEGLRSLLANVDTPPLEHADALAAMRESLLDDPLLAMDLDRLELRFLEKQGARRDIGDDVRTAVRVARIESLDRTQLRIARGPADDPAAVFDLAELRAAYLQEGREAEAEAVAVSLRGRIETVPLDDALKAEARERFAAIITDEQDLGLGHKIHLLRETGLAMASLHARSGDRFYGKLARRLKRTEGDRGLYQRLESLLTRRGVVLLETTSLLLLVVVFVLLAVEFSVELTTNAQSAIALADALICSFFIVEFLFKLALAPARMSWFSRNVVTDLLPAIPAVFMFGDGWLTTLRSARFVRLVAFARYMRAIRPILGFFRLLLFLIRGLDSVVARFSPLINRNFVFFEAGTQRGDELNPDDPRLLLFQAMRREHVLIDDARPENAEAVLIRRSNALAERLQTREIAIAQRAAPAAAARDVPVEEAIERLYTLRPDELSLTMSQTDLMALDRVSRVINAPVIRLLPLVRRLSSRSPGDTPEARIVSLGRRVADELERWRSRILFFADLHGIVTGPQILDRVATAMVKASQRPAVRLLMFGVLFTIVRMFVGDGVLNDVLGRFVATPLVVLGIVCFVILFTGRWLKRLAGEAAENLKRTSEAHFINLLELEKARTRDSDLVFLAGRVFRFEIDAWEAALALGQQVQEATSIQIDIGNAEERAKEPPIAIREDLTRVALLYLHFLDGAILHESDIKTTEQLLANLSLENIRRHHLEFSRRDHKRVRKLSLASGSMLSGPYLWFRFMTESVSLEAAKRITEYNRHCMTLQQCEVSTEEEVQDMRNWVAKRRAEVEGRILEKIDPPEAGAIFRTTEFNAMDFLAVNERRDAQIERVFGREVLDVLMRDRRSMIREIFGTRPLHKRPRSERSVNFYRFFLNRLSRGRVLLAPIYMLATLMWALRAVFGKTVSIVREIMRPETAGANRESGRASFRVALRKIHRMKAPGLLEAMLMRCAFDPAYCGAPPTWSFGMAMAASPELERDMDFLQMRERERVIMRSIAGANRRRVEQLHGLVRGFGDTFGEVDDEIEQKLGERAVTIAYITNRDNLRSLFQAERWLERELPRLEHAQTKIRASMWRALLATCRRRFTRNPMRRLLDTKLADRRVSQRGRQNLVKSWVMDIGDTRQTVAAWLRLPDDVSPRDRALALATRFFRGHGEVSRELTALRAVQSLSVLDVRNYRKLVFQLGGYEDDGEDPELSQALP